MNTNDNCGLAILKWLVTILSFAISLPGYFDSKSKIAFILTACVIIFGKFIESIEGIIRNKAIFHTIFNILGSVLGVVAIGFCFYYFSAIFNVTQLVEKSVSIVSGTDMSKYPLFEGEFFYVLLFLTLVYYIIQETIFCGCDLCKYIHTKKRVLLSRKKSNDLLDIPLE